MKSLWTKKLAAWLHDPAEKALILLRDKEGHEWGTVKRLRDELGIDYSDMLKPADWYASAADRPQFPLEKDGSRYAAWTQVDFANEAVLKHPLTGGEYKLGKLDDIQPSHLKKVSEDHFRKLIIRNEDGSPDFQRTLLNSWRFGPDSPASELNHLWQNLPADTRIPDHSIWAHLDIVSAFAGAMAADKDGTPALLSVSFGPVQGFIAEARSTSDLWAGSHLLARIAWEGMKLVCKKLGPDAVLFPNLRGVPLVDVWLYDQLKTDIKARDRFENMDWFKQTTDANPLFAAVLPNRFVALVPADQAKAIAEEIERRTRTFITDTGSQALLKILETIGEPTSSELPCYQQLDEQLQGFPEVYWAAVPWSLAETAGKPDADKLRPILSNFYGDSDEVGFLDSNAWKVLQKDIELDGAKFYQPNPGVLYPALYELLDRVAAAAKSARPFEQLRQEGYRSSLNGEQEWLTLDRGQLTAPPGERKDTLWTRLAEKQKSWVKKGEHLDALNTIKRLWPSLVVDEVNEIVGLDIKRYVVSTHTLALAVSMDKWLDNPRDIPLKLRNLLESIDADRTALPRRLMNKLHKSTHHDAELLCRKLPGVLDFIKNMDDGNGKKEEMLRTAEAEIKQLVGTKPEVYYGMILLDGDRMGAWLSGTSWKDEAGEEVDPRLCYRDSWHPQILNSGAFKTIVDKNPLLQDYLTQKRPPSPARHRAISEALNHFSINVARFVVEDCFKGKLIYAGGDDVMAFVCVDDLFPAMTLLRYLYSGKAVPDWAMEKLDDKTTQRFECKNGYLLLDKQLLLTMGEKAEASCGAVVAHHQAPLGYVLGQLRAAESRAKTEGKRNAFSLRIIKRAGGEIGVTDKWMREDEYKNAPELLSKLMGMLKQPKVSRRATYNSLIWLQQLPPQPDVDMLKVNLAYQFKQQGAGEDGANLAIELATYAATHFPDKSAQVLEDMLMTAEFLARQTRHDQDSEKLQQKESAA